MSVYLATRGKQDYFLTENPEFTLFNNTYSKDLPHTNTIINVPFDSGAGTIATIPMNGDYISEITLKIILPPLKPQSDNWIFRDTPPSGNVTFYQNDVSIATINSSDYLSYISSGVFKFNFSNRKIEQSLPQTYFYVTADYIGTNFYVIDLDLNINKNNNSLTPSGLSSSYAYMTMSKDGSYLYISDFYGGNIIRVSTSTMTVNISFFTGLNHPSSISIDNNGKLYVLCGSDTQAIEIINTIPSVPTKTTIALPNTFSYLLCVDFTGKYIYLLYGNNGLTRIDTNTLEIIEYFNSSIENDYVSDMQIDAYNILYLSYYYRGSISKVSTETGIVTPNYVINLSNPISISITSNGKLYILGWNFPSYLSIVYPLLTPIDYVIFDNIDIANYYGFTNVTKLLGGYYRYSLPISSENLRSTSYLDECGWIHAVTNELMKNPGEMVTSSDGILVYFVDSENSTIRQMSTSSPFTIVTIAGKAGTPGSADGPGKSARFFKPQGLTISPDGTKLFVADTQNYTIRQVETIFPYNVTTIAGTAGTPGSADGTGSIATFDYIQALDISPDGTKLFVADTRNFTIRQVATIFPYNVTTIAGTAGTPGSADGIGSIARFNYPQALVCSPDGTKLFVADTQNYTIRQVYTETGIVTTIAGTAGTSGSADGIGSIAKFNPVQSLTLSKNGTILYVGDSNVLRQMIISYPYVVSTLAGTQSQTGSSDGIGINSTFNKIQGMTMSRSGTLIYLSDTGNSILRQVNTTSPYKVTTLAGSPFISGSSDTEINKYPDDTSYYYINSISLSVGKQVIQQLPGGYLKMKRDISNTYKNRPILKLLEGDTNISSQPRIYYLKTGLINNIPMHLFKNQDVQLIVDTKIKNKSLIINYSSFGNTKLPQQYKMIVPQVQMFHESGDLNIKGPISKLMADKPFTFSINGENLFDSDTSNVSQLENLLNVSSGYINVFKSPMNMSRIRTKSIHCPRSNIWAETFNVLDVQNGISGLLFESCFYSFSAPPSYLISQN